MNMRRIAKVTLVLVVLACTVLRPSARSVVEPSVSGKVIAATDKQPVRGATIVLTNLADPGLTFSTKSDLGGAFQFDVLTPGRYAIRASKTGWIGTFAALAPQSLGSPVTVTKDEAIRDLSLRLTPAAVISGSVYSDNGTPVPGIEVRVFRYIAGAGVQDAIAVGNTASLVTDDRGEYRVYDLPPGDYIVEAQPKASSDSARVGYAPVYYPSTADLSAAAVVSLAPGNERLGLDLRLRLEPVWRVSGTVQTPDRQMSTPTSVTLIGAKNGRLGFRRTVQTYPEGRFEIVDVPAGDYVLYARSQSDRKLGQRTEDEIAQTTYSRQEIHVASDLQVDLSLSAGVAVDGVVSFSTAAQPQTESLKTVAVSLASQEGFTSLAAPTIIPDEKGRFTFPNVPPGRYEVSAIGRLADGRLCYLSKVIHPSGVESNEVLVTQNRPVTGIDLQFRIDSGGIAGTLTTATYSSPTDYLVAVFPADPSRWGKPGPSHAYVRPKSSGTFELKELPPGRYLLVTFASPGDLVLFTPPSLSQAAPFAIKVEVKSGTITLQDLRVAGLPTYSGRALWLQSQTNH